MEKYFNDICQAEVRTEAKSVRRSMTLFITTVTSVITVPSPVVSGQEWMHRRLWQDFKHCPPETALAQQDPLHNAAESKPAGGGVRLVCCRNPTKKAEAVTAV